MHATFGQTGFTSLHCLASVAATRPAEGRTSPGSNSRRAAWESRACVPPACQALFPNELSNTGALLTHLVFFFFFFLNRVSANLAAYGRSPMSGLRSDEIDSSKHRMVSQNAFGDRQIVQAPIECKHGGAGTGARWCAH